MGTLLLLFAGCLLLLIWLIVGVLVVASIGAVSVGAHAICRGLTTRSECCPP